MTLIIIMGKVGFVRLTCKVLAFTIQPLVSGKFKVILQVGF